MRPRQARRDTVTVTVLSSGGGALHRPLGPAPYQRINAGETLKAGVVAFSKFGINTVSFSISGGGYTRRRRDLSSMSYNDQSNVYEYWLPISAASFTTDGPITVNATVYGGDGGKRTLPGLRWW